MIYGYARVSTDGQSVGAQVRQLAKARMQKGLPRDSERRKDRPHPAAQGARTNRRRRCADGDETRPAGTLDAGSPEHLATVADRKAGFRSLGDAWADTTSPHGRLMLTVLGGLAEFERELIRARTGEGHSHACPAGVHCRCRRTRLIPFPGILRGQYSQPAHAPLFSAKKATQCRVCQEISVVAQFDGIDNATPL
jgi:hypothetical protein